MTSNHSLTSSLGKPIAGIFSALGMSRKESHPESEEITINVDPPVRRTLYSFSAPESNKVCYLLSLARQAGEPISSHPFKIQTRI